MTEDNSKNLDLECFYGSQTALLDNSVSAKYANRTSTSVYYHTEVDFGEVAIGKKAIEFVYIENNSGDVQMYSVNQESSLLEFYEAFRCKIINNTSEAVQQNETIQCKVSYKPVVPCEKSSSKFLVVDSSNNYHIIYTRGTSVGPVISSSIQYLNFFIIKNLKQRQLTFQLTNSSIAETTFQFDVNNHEKDYFRVLPDSGKLAANSHIYVTVYFCATKEGSYSKKLFCLFMHHEPILLTLFGIIKPDASYNPSELKIIRLLVAPKCVHGINTYLSDYSGFCCQAKFFFNETFMCFTSSKTLSTILTNNTHYDLEVSWDQDHDNIFGIIPRYRIIPAKQAFLFECLFNPKHENKVYSTRLIANINWIERASVMLEPRDTASVTAKQIEIKAPACHELRLFGHTLNVAYPVIFRIEFEPETVILPPCTPNSSSFGSFTIKTESKVPLLFRFIKPKKTAVLIKPMAGVLRSTQIIVTQYQPSIIERQRVEKWKLIINEVENRLLTVIIKARCDLPAIIIGNNNQIQFPITQIGEMSSILVPLKNRCDFLLKYEFLLHSNDHLEIVEKEGNLCAMGENYIQVRFKASTCVPSACEILCRCYVVHRNKCVTGYSLETNVTVLTPCEFSQLCAVPKEIDFGEIKWNSQLRSGFDIFNFGRPLVSFALAAKANLKCKLSISPLTGAVKPKEKSHIDFSLTVQEEGKGEIVLSYGSQSDVVTVVTIKYQCVFPTVQVVDIISHNYNHLFGKSALWELLNLTALNKALKTTTNDSVQEVTFHLPHYELNEDAFNVRFSLENVTNFTATVSTKRIKKCDCEAVETNEHFTFRKKVFLCPHREMFTLSLSQNDIHPKTSTALNLDVKYTGSGKNNLFYELKLNDTITINIKAEVVGLTCDICTLSSYKVDNKMIFNDVFIGEKDPPLQLFWLYNNSCSAVTYNLDDHKLVKLCDQTDFNIFECLNPIDRIEPYGAGPIIFRFHPIEAKTYKVNLPLLMGDKVVQLKLEGKGKGQYKFDPEILKGPLASVCKIYAEVPVNFSTDNLQVEYLPIWKTTERMIYIRNETKNTTYKYEWQNVILEGLLHITTDIKDGYLEPKMAHRVIIKMSSLGEPGIIKTLLPCKLLDHTQVLRHDTTTNLYNEKEKELSIQTKSESLFSENDVVIEPNPKPFYLNLEIGVYVIGSQIDNLYADIPTQNKNYPYETVDLNVPDIIDRYGELIADTECPIGNFSLKNLVALKHRNLKNTGEPTEKPAIRPEDSPMIREMLTSLIGEVLFSDKLKHVIRDEINRSPDYYVQYKYRSKKGSLGAEQQNTFKETKLENITEAARVYLETPKVGELTETVNCLIREGLKWLSPEDVSADSHSESK